MDGIQNELIYWLFITGVIVVCLFLMFRLYLSYQRRNKVRVWIAWILLGGFIGCILFVNELIPGSDAYYDYQYTKRILGKGILLDEVYTYESYREPLLGDGYSMYVYEFSEENANYFSDPSQLFFDNFPFGTDASNEHVKNWQQSPTTSIDSIYRRFALSEYSSFGPKEETDLLKAERLIGALLNEKGNYFAYRARVPEEDWVTDITFFALCPKKKWLIAIYSNT